MSNDGYHPQGSDDYKRLNLATTVWRLETRADREARARLIAKVQRENRGRLIARIILSALCLVSVVWFIVAFQIWMGD